MTTQADILGRPPVMKARPEPADRPDPNWKGEHLIRNAKVHRLGNKFTVENAMRKAMRAKRK